MAMKTDAFINSQIKHNTASPIHGLTNESGIKTGFSDWLQRTKAETQLDLVYAAFDCETIMDDADFLKYVKSDVAIDALTDYEREEYESRKALLGDAVIWTYCLIFPNGTIHSGKTDTALELMQLMLTCGDSDFIIPDSNIYKRDFDAILNNFPVNGKNQRLKTRWYAHNAGFDIIRFESALHYYRLLEEDFKCVENGEVVVKRGHPYTVELLESGKNNFIQYRVNYKTVKQVMVDVGENRTDKRTQKREWVNSKKLLVDIRDSSALFNPGTKLEKLAKQIDDYNRKHVDGYSDADSISKLVGNIDFAREQFNVENAKHVEYAINDSVILVKCIKAWNEIIFNNFGVNIRLTAASTALAAWKRTIPEGHKYPRLSKSNEEFVRKCYQGGFVNLGIESLNPIITEAAYTDITNAYTVDSGTVIKTRDIESTIYDDLLAGEINSVYVDANSMYPYVMRLFGVPVGACTWTNEYNDKAFGFYHVRVTHTGELNGANFPTIFHRDTVGLSTPQGTFETFCTSVDIESAIKSGSTVEVIEGLYFYKVEKPFNEFITICEQLRKEGGAVEMAAKLMQNSLYGKFGTNPHSTRTVLSFEKPECSVGVKVFSYLDDMSDVMTLSGQSVDDIFDSQHVEHKWLIAETMDENYMLPHWAAWITAQARNHLHSVIRLIGYENFRYADTDSIVMDMAGWNKIANSSMVWTPNSGKPKRYGDWKVEHFLAGFVAVAPKVYALAEYLGDNGKSIDSLKSGDRCKLTISGRSKGAPRRFASEQYFVNPLLGCKLPSTISLSVVGLASSMINGKRGVFVNRSSSDIKNSGKFMVKDGKVYPKYIITEH